jgi:hypothetical protein
VKRLFALLTLLVVLLLGPPPAAALQLSQGGPTDAEPPTALAPLATASPVGGPAPSASADTRPARGPAVRERGGRRTRAGSSATGFLMIVVFVAFVGYYVLKKIRRY